jgi:hypothetical protein
MAKNLAAFLKAPLGKPALRFASPVLAALGALLNE